MVDGIEVVVIVGGVVDFIMMLWSDVQPLKADLPIVVKLSGS